MSPESTALITNLKNIVEQIEMAMEDAVDDFEAGISHAEIALHLLSQTVEAGKAT